ncbi:MAG: DUF2878 family protein [Nanoarchaeota archaeon]|nr:DUF2878 family protein [Nanoarchaeota archaeon]
MLTTGLLLIIAIYSLIRWKSRRTLITFIYCALVGTIAEIICGYAGVWEYSVTNFLNIPIWLFILWGNAGAVIYQVARYIRKKRRG